MSVPTQTAVLVVGGGPGGSYAASVLAREGVDVVLLDAEKFPRYHIGESMLASMRFFLRFIDLEETFDRHGFEKKYGATFKITTKKEAFTNFAASLGQGGFSWNVIRSESDELIFRHAGDSGAKTFDGTKVDSISFEPYADETFNAEARLANPGRPVSANWSRKDGTSGTIKFDYLIDASGRNGIISTKYLKNRKFNEGLKNIANWAYWKGAKRFKPGAENENSPFFEALSDGSGWVWAIPLHNGTLSVGIAARQNFFFGRKKASGLDGIAFYKDYLNLAPQIKEMLNDAEVVSGIKQASDWSYSASAYAGPHFRVVGDAGCFVDPYFSSGVHLALTSGLSAALSIQASRRGQADERTAAHWHTTKVSEGYTRFLLLVMTVLRQLRLKESQIITSEEEEGFDMAFKTIQPVIQGVADTRTEDAQTQKHAAESVNFALGSFEITPEKQQAVISKIAQAQSEPETLEKLSPEEVHILDNISKRNFEREKDELDLTSFAGDIIDGFSARLVRGDLGLYKREAKPEAALSSAPVELKAAAFSRGVEQAA
ncbi:FAD/NAD(P)-binding domain-containing protein [Mollisia scopiformis]|uniref:FAD/NAD(P)-binding domain-containing protein n=1 Tax=Mollisia scopiformis TaxID=149040 RepID=A0A194X080_MOLSC|nr:FAD/NAD(P)-binding domain-containing protein [Mollisia scopiformis]KUJ13601.1 FAD/NAD(P)-binding domain-containing protein [Mollisia scopiformis]